MKETGEFGTVDFALGATGVCAATSYRVLRLVDTYCARAQSKLTGRIRMPEESMLLYSGQPWETATLQGNDDINN
jgi:hypothetical protein